MPEPRLGFGAGFAISAAGLVLNLGVGLLRGQVPGSLRTGLFMLGAVLVVVGLVVQVRGVGRDRR
ncbi:MAG: hypothetical protein Q4F49_09275 [Pseudoxanthomonas suwonensis]|nr:hypothetical protein [Pseudoxanthomonas suwonensis]